MLGIQDAAAQYMDYVKDSSQIKPTIGTFSVVSKSDAPMVGYVANAIMTRTVKPDLQLLAGHLMQTIAHESGAPLSHLSDQVPGELAFLFSKYLDLWHGSGDITLSKEQTELLMTEYVHCSDNWTPVGPLYVNAPAPGRVLRIYQQSPGK